MPSNPPSKDADSDAAARRALWKAICFAAQQLAQQCTVYISSSANGKLQNVIGQPIPDVRTWQLMEALSLLAIFLRADKVAAAAVTLFTKSGPLEFQEDSEPRYLWVQCGLEGAHSALGGRLDLLITSTPARPSPDNIIRVVEAKSGRNIGAQTVRAEFGKAHDLGVGTYFIWTFFTASPRIIEGARGLGLDIQELGMDTDRRADLLHQPEALVSYVGHTLEQARKRQQFASRAEGRSREIRRKLGPAT